MPTRAAAPAGACGSVVRAAPPNGQIQPQNVELLLAVDQHVGGRTGGTFRGRLDPDDQRVVRFLDRVLPDGWNQATVSADQAMPQGLEGKSVAPVYGHTKPPVQALDPGVARPGNMEELPEFQLVKNVVDLFRFGNLCGVNEVHRFREMGNERFRFQEKLSVMVLQRRVVRIIWIYTHEFLLG